MIVHADANDVVVEADLRRRRDSSRTVARKAYRIVCDTSRRVGCGSQIVVKVFKLCAPIGGKHPLAASTHGVSNAGLRKQPRCQGGGKRIGIDYGYGLSDRGVGLGSAIRQATCCIQQKARSDQEFINPGALVGAPAPAATAAAQAASKAGVPPGSGRAL
jgi:hypothetical protein